MESEPNFIEPNLYHPKHRIKVYFWIALVVAALLIAVNGYLYFLRLSYLQQGLQAHQEGERKVQELKQAREESSSIMEQFDMSDWKTYRNEEYGFEFKYPGDWILEIPGFNDRVIVKPNANIEESGQLTIDTGDHYLSVFNNDPGNQCIKEVIFSGKKAMECIILSDKFYSREIKISNSNDLWNENNLISFTANLNFQNHKDLYNQILSTFRFLD